MAASFGSRNGCLVTRNITFDYTTDPQPGDPSIINADGQLLIGSITTTPNIAMTAGNLLPGAGVTVTYAYPNITIGLTGGAAAIEKFTVDAGVSPVSPSGGIVNLAGTTNQITTTGSNPNAVTYSLSSTLIAPGSVTATGILTTNSGIVRHVTVPGAYPYTVLTTDDIISVNTGSARTINLPNAPTTGSTWVIKDVTGNAAAANISVTTPGGVVTIDGSTTYTINANYGSITVYFNGSSYFVI